MPRKSVGDKRVAKGLPRQSPSDKKSDKKQLVQKRRAERNRARRKAIKAGTARKGDGKDVDHTKGKKSGKLSGPTRVISRNANRRKNKK